MNSPAWILSALFLCRPAVYAGTSKSLASSSFAGGTLENLAIVGNDLTLIKEWSYGGQAPLPARYQAGFAFDETRKQAVLFGGRDDSGNIFADTWVWDSLTGWTQKNPAGPPAARYGHGLVWAGDKFLLFGGSAGNDTWTYDITANTWTYIPVSNPPPYRTLFGMAYDGDLNKAVVFGGVPNNVTWIFDMTAAEWSSFNTSTAPTARTGTQMAYDRNNKKIILFGGQDWISASLLNDTWSFDVAAASWTARNPSLKPPPRTQSAMAYDVNSGRVFLYGGKVASGLAGDLGFYDFTGDRWAVFYEYDPNAPSGHSGHGLIYDTLSRKAVVFAGKQDVPVKSMWLYDFRSSGTWISGPVDAWAGFVATTSVTWDSVAAVFSEAPAGTGVLLQLASSGDGGSYDSFRGPDGSTLTYYAADVVAQNIWTGHRDRRFVKLKTVFISNDAPARPKLTAFNIAYNRAPWALSLKIPADNGRINDSTPLFRWNTSSDPDGIFTDWPLAYHIQVSSLSDFSRTALSEENISAGASDVFFTTGTELGEGVWYWRARARDPAGLYGLWSGAFSVLIDTHTPPGPVTVMSAARGAIPASVSLSWTFPGDDKGRVDNGRYRVRFSTQGPVLTEEAWAAAEERSGLFSAAPLEVVKTDVTGLGYAATYYFAIKTEDEIGNISGLSTVSPFEMTDASPTVTLRSPDGGELIVNITTITWTQSDPNPGDTLTNALFLSSDGGGSYSILIASGITGNTVSYPWYSGIVSNGTAYRIKIVARDQRGLSATDVAGGNFQIDNLNNSPLVRFTGAPSADEIISGDRQLSWEVTDFNTLDTHTYRVLLSRDSGSSFIILADGLTQTSYTFNTKAFPNLFTYQLKITATDSGNPPLSGSALSPVFGIVNSLPPKGFNLTGPVEDTFPALFDLKFSWEAAVDPEGGVVFYTLRYSTVAGPAGGTVITGLTGTEYVPAPGSLFMDMEYFWQVTAEDSYAKKTQSAPAKFIMLKSKAKSPDGLLLAEVRGGMPAQGYLSFSNARVSSKGIVESADMKMKGERLNRTLSSLAWDVSIKTVEGEHLSGDNISAKLTFLYSAAKKGNLLDTVVDVEHVKIARLDAESGRWKVLPGQQIPDSVSGSISVEVAGLSIFSVLGSIAPASMLSGVFNYPNPFAAGRENTRIRYILTGDYDVTVRIYTLLGELVQVIECAAGTSDCGQGTARGISNEIQWDGKNGEGRVVANGMYLAQIRAKSSSAQETETRRIGVIK